MSHLKERKEKNCLNCNADIQGRFCHVCGQENIEPKESVWHLVSHFFQDITHFDGKFFSTLKWLIIRPGFLSKEYMAGRRASYLNPIRMYVFTSAFFFLIFFSLYKMELDSSSFDINGKTMTDIAKMDSASFADFTREINRNDEKGDKPMTRAEFSAFVDTIFKGKSKGISIGGFHYASRAEYDSLQQLAPSKDGWVKRQLVYKTIDINTKYHNDTKAIIESFKATLLHSIPQMLFISLPLLALILQLLYRRRKEFYYVNHVIFGIHLYIFIFIALLVIFGLNKLNDQLHWGAITFLSTLISFFIFFYDYKAMRKFYGQGRGKTLLKFILFNIVFLFLVGLLFIIFVFFSYFKI